MEQLIAFLLLPIAYLAAVGWGSLLERFVYRSPPDRSPYTAVLGLLLLLLLGACLNHLALARPVAFDLLLVGGTLLAYQHWRRQGRSFAWFAFGPESIPPLVALAFGAFFAWHLLPASAFNYHDDFYKYLPRFVRMLDTGSLVGNPFGFVGVDSLGMQTFLQGLPSARLPLAYINGFDAVFCLTLAGLLLDSLGRCCGVHWLLRTLAVAALVVFDPQYVNIGAVYSAMTMIIALALATLFLLRDRPAHGGSARLALPLGLLAAATAGLKVTLAFFPAAFLAACFALLLVLQPDRRQTFGLAAWAGASAVALFGAWATLSVPNLKNLLTAKTKSMAKAVAKTVSPAERSEPETYLQEILAGGDLYYGGHLNDYLALFVLVALLVVLTSFLLLRWPERRETLLPAAVTGIAAVLSVVGVYFGVHGIHVDAFVRYNAPVLIASLLVLALLLAGSFGAGSAGGFTAPRRRARLALAVLLVGTPLLIHADLGLDRARLAMAERTLLSFPINEYYRRLMAKSFAPETRAKLRSIQDQVPPGVTFLAWVSTPFHLDFGRNEIFTLAATGGPGPLRRIVGVPPAKRADWLERRLRALGVEYVMWEYRGPPKESGAAKAAIVESLVALARTRPIGYRDGTWIVIRIGPDQLSGAGRGGASAPGKRSSRKKAASSDRFASPDFR